MRVIGGALKGRHISTAKGTSIRPTTDKVREAVFSILAPSLKGGAVLDLFAGAGTLGIEAMSRGMDRVVFIEDSAQALAILKKNVAACKLERQVEIIKLPVSRGLRIVRLRKERFDLIFLDPPYRDRLVGKSLLEISEADIVAADGTIVAEHAVREVIDQRYGALLLDDQRQYGQTMISFFIKKV